MIDLIIIGGGAAGSFLSSLLSSSHLFEKTDRLMTKLLMTGGGACNLTNECDTKTLVSMYHDRKAFVSPCLYSFTPKNIMEHFLSLGVETTVREDGKVFPSSMEARSIADAICRNMNNIHLSEAVTDIERKDGYFTVKTVKGTYDAHNVCVATGGASYPSTGSDGSFFPILKKLGHRIIPLRPALSALKTDIDTSSIQGITAENVTLT
ncbi:MAG: NAD(P)/FAD-dependent oxidoreductase, partial [Bullifex sp.]